MHRFSVFFVLWLWFVPYTIYGQRTVSGRVVEAGSNDPISGASVFIANTSMGDITDSTGRYQLKIPAGGSYNLTVSYVGYQPVFKDIEPGTTAIELDVFMKPHELEEVTVSSKVKFRRKDINLFWNTILGKSPSKRTIYAANPESVYYYYNTQTGILTVTCREPLFIINNETGYQIQYVQDRFTHNYKTDISSWSGKHMFTELIPESDRQKAVWDQNRKKVYRVSMSNFIKSLYHNTLLENGFLLAYPKIEEKSKAGDLIQYVNPNQFLSDAAADGGKTLSIPPGIKDLMLVCFGKPVSDLDLFDVNEAKNDVSKWQRTGLYRNILQTPGVPVRIFPDGTFNKPPLLLTCFLSGSLTGLDLKLPVEYMPDFDSEADPVIVEEDIVAVNISGIQDSIYKQLELFPQEKIHLHTDRNMYVPGERIWFTAFVVDAFTHRSPTFSQYAYVELVNASDSLVRRVMVRRDEFGLFHGNIFLSDFVPEGNYTLRAYTRYMENLGDDYFFKKHIRINNLNVGLPHPDRFAVSSPSPSLSGGQLYDVSFYPEGGYLVEDINCRVAFKALNSKGAAESITGVIVDNDNNRIAEINTVHAGMGSFAFTPEAGKTYFLNCKNQSGTTNRFQLPPAQKTYALSVGFQKDRYFVEVRSSPDMPELPLFLLVHCRGEILYFDLWNYQDGAITFSGDLFPSGVIQIALFDGNLNPVSERLIFNKNDDQAKLVFSSDKLYYQKREKVSVEIAVTDFDGFPLTGYASIAVTDDRDIAVETGHTIASSLLLSSELRGYIESPAYYLNDDKDAGYALDLLMMTHGWRRYELSDAIKGNYTFPGIGFEEIKKITGTVNRRFLRRPAANSEVTIFSSYGITDQIETDSAGLFTFYVHPPDSVSYKLLARGQRGNENVELTIIPEQFPVIKHAPNSPAFMPADTSRANQVTDVPSDFLLKAEQRSKYDDDIRFIQLDEVTVTASAVAKKDELRLKYAFNASSDATLYREDIEKRNAQSVTELLKMIPGLQVINNSEVYIRGSQILAGGAQPLVVIDGVIQASLEIDGVIQASLEDLSVHDVENIDVFKGSSASYFGARGMYGVISVTTRRGRSATDVNESAGLNAVSLFPLGFQKPVEFYAPRYDTAAAKSLSIPDYRTTIFWKPDVLIDDDGKASIEFYTADFPTTYSVVIEGLSNDGEIIRQVETIEVK